jgi:hypothetical protein
MTSIFELWRENKKRVPFVARRCTWKNFVVVVCRVEPKGHYGRAFGYVVSIGGKPLEPRKPGNAWGASADAPGEIDCDGCGQWDFAELPQPSPGEIK